MKVIWETKKAAEIDGTQVEMQQLVSSQA